MEPLEEAPGKGAQQTQGHGVEAGKRTMKEVTQCDKKMNELQLPLATRLAVANFELGV